MSSQPQKRKYYYQEDENHVLIVIIQIHHHGVAALQGKFVLLLTAPSNFFDRKYNLFKERTIFS